MVQEEKDKLALLRNGPTWIINCLGTENSPIVMEITNRSTKSGYAVKTWKPAVEPFKYECLCVRWAKMDTNNDKLSIFPWFEIDLSKFGIFFNKNLSLHCYKWSMYPDSAVIRVSYDDCNTRCHNLGGMIPAPTTEEENNIIKKCIPVDWKVWTSLSFVKYKSSKCPGQNVQDSQGNKVSFNDWQNEPEESSPANISSYILNNSMNGFTIRRILLENILTIAENQISL